MSPDPKRSSLVPLILALAGFAIAVTIIAAFSLKAGIDRGTRVAQAELQAISHLKAGEVLRWRHERLGEATFLLRTPAVIADVTAAVRQPGDQAAHARLLGWLETIKGGARYEAVLVFNPLGELIESLADSAPARTPPSRAALDRTLAGTEVVFGEIEPRGAGQFQIDLLVPIRPPGSTPPNPPVGLIVLRLDPARVLFPLVQNWPRQSATAESLLVRREGNEVVFLNTLRHRADLPLSLRFSIDKPKLLAARAGRDEQGVFEGTDYRGSDVLGVIQAIPETSWRLIAKIDRDEVYAPIRAEAWKSGALFGLLLLASALTGLIVWRQRHFAYLQRVLAAEVQRNAAAERLALITEHVSDAIVLFDSGTLILEANQHAQRLYGYSLAELRQLRAGDLRAPETLAATEADFAQSLTTTGLRFETVHRRHDGTEFPVEVNAKPLEIEGRRHVLSIIRDITERRAQEAEILRLDRIYQVLSHVNQAVVRSRDRPELIDRVCRILVEIGGFKLAWLGWLDPEIQRLDPVAVAGDTHGYVAHLRISANPKFIESQGPSGVAFREKRLYVCNDFHNDPATGPWRELAARSGIESSIALPISFAGQTAGLLSVYADTKNFFGAREVPLLQEVAGDLSFALDALAGEERRKAAEIGLAASHAFNIAVLDSIDDQIAVLDAHGVILAVNAAWRAFAEKNGAPKWGAQVVGTDYLRVCEAAGNTLEATDGANAHAGILAVIAGDLPEFGCEYPCHSPTEARWFQMRVTPLTGPRRGVVVAHKNITASRLAEAHLRNLSHIVEQAPLSIAITDLTGAISYVNPAFCAVSGYTAAEVIGRNHRVLKSGETPTAVYRDMWTTLVEGRVWRGELSNRRKDGQIFFESAVIAPVTDETGRVTHYVALKEDITAAKRTADALREVQDRYRLVAENTADVIWLYDLAADRFTYCSPSVQRLRGYTVAEVLGQKIAEALTPESAADLARELPRRIAAFAAGDPAAITQATEVSQKRRDGSFVATEVVTTLLADSTGKVTQILGVSRDATERVNAREALQRFNSELEFKIAERTAELAARNREMEALLQAIPDTVMRLRTDGTVLHKQVGPGSPDIEFAGATSDPFALPPSLELARRALGAESIVTAEAELKLPTGPATVELRAAPSGPDEVVVFARDITARKRLETETAAMLEKEHQVSEMKTRFISVTSHEFRTPMAAAMGSAELLHYHFDRLAPAKREDLFARIHASLNRMTEMLDDILILNRMDANRTEVRLGPVDARLLLHNVVEEIRLADREGHRFELLATGEPAPFVSDPNLLHHILTNLLSNAARYSPPGSLVTLHLDSTDTAMTITVNDEGIGIPAEDRARLFQPFERGSNVGNIKGTGLGLSIVKRMTELLGGTIALDSSIGAGTRFTLVFRRLAPPPAT